MFNPELVILFIAAIPIGIFGIVVGGNATLSVPVFQILFPEMTLGAIIGNIKPGSVVRNLTSLIPLWRDVNYKLISPLLIPLGAGSVVGALLIAEISQTFVLVILVLGFFVVEYAEKIAKYVTKQIHILSSLLVGMYGGVFGAGVSLLLVALMRLNNTADKEIYKTRADALFLETFFTTAAVVVFVYYGLLIPFVTIAWAAGAIIGGYLGGVVLKKTGKLSGSTQVNILRTAFIFAICVAMIKTFS